MNSFLREMQEISEQAEAKVIAVQKQRDRQLGNLVALIQIPAALTAIWLVLRILG